MEIRVAKTAGFCFGVKRAVDLTYGLLNEGCKVATLGPLIHNPQAVEDMQKKGALVADAIADVPAGYEVVIRSHGVPRTVYDELDARGITYHDATCPFVQKIQRIAIEAEKAGAVLLVAGDKTHPEVQGIVGHTRGEVFVFADLAELKAWKGPSDPQKPLFAVAQTTFQVTKWQESSEFLKKAYTNARIFDTICNATWARQQEAEDLSQQCDIIVVIGGHHSSNTQKLVQVAAKHTRAVTVETASELRPEWFADVKTAGVTAGASTPSSIIEEVLNSMSAEINDSMSFEEMLNASEEKRVHAGSIVKGIVTSISANEIQVDIGAKQTGFVKLSELTDDSSAKVEDLVKVGDELDLIVEKVMDQDGVIQLSRKKLASRKGMEEIAKAAESGEVVEGDVTEFNKGGVVVNVKGVKAGDKFLGDLAGVTDPEAKRKIIGRDFVEVFNEEAIQIKDVKWLAQGTIYPDVIESCSVNGPSATIKSHHNVGGLPEKMNLKIVEPLRLLFKDEVRRVGRSMGISEQLIGRHPFPGPGLAIRILGDITPEKVEILQNVDKIYIDSLRAAGLYDQVWQAGAVLLPVKSVGVMGDERTYESCVALRAVTSTDGMTADWVHLPYEFLANVSNDIINKVKGVNRVVYDISSKPPATIEWE